MFFNLEIYKLELNAGGGGGGGGGMDVVAFQEAVIHL